MLKVLFIILFSITCIAQDEWFFKDMLRGKSRPFVKEKSKVHFRSRGPLYHLDISGDEVKEYVGFISEDGKQFVRIYDKDRKKILEHKFEIKGYGARVYKISTRKISPTRKLTLFHFFDGKTEYLEKRGSSTIHALVVEDNNLKFLKVNKIAGIWIEQQVRDNYLRRPYHLTFEDLDQNGIDDIVVHSGSARKVVFYLGKNQWKIL